MCCVTSTRQPALPIGWGGGTPWGEEFAIRLPGMTGDKARTLAEQIRCGTEELVSGDGVRFTVSLALGISQSGRGWMPQFQRTDLAPYQAKHRGRNRVELA